jgi:peptidoglycan hydrolase CwlO-like protein
MSGDMLFATPGASGTMSPVDALELAEHRKAERERLIRRIEELEAFKAIHAETHEMLDAKIAELEARIAVLEGDKAAIAQQKADEEARKAQEEADRIAAAEAEKAAKAAAAAGKGGKAGSRPGWL